MCQHAQPKTYLLYLYGFTQYKSDLKTGSVTKKKKGHFIIREMLSHWKNSMHTQCTPNHRASKDTKVKLSSYYAIGESVGVRDRDTLSVEMRDRLLPLTGKSLVLGSLCTSFMSKRSLCF